jgi:hypothetical protein
MSKGNRIGAIWRSQSQNDHAPFAKGRVEIDGKTIQIVLWANGYKADDLASSDASTRERAHRSPDYYVEIDVPRDGPTYANGEGFQGPGPSAATNPSPKPAAQKPPMQTTIEPSDDGFGDEIPF